MTARAVRRAAAQLRRQRRRAPCSPSAAGHRAGGCPAGHRPRASPGPCGGVVTNLRHASVRIEDDLGRRLVTLLDGTRDRAALAAELRTYLLDQRPSGPRRPGRQPGAQPAGARAPRAARAARVASLCASVHRLANAQEDRPRAVRRAAAQLRRQRRRAPCAPAATDDQSGDAPRATALARHQARAGETVTNLRHASVRIEDDLGRRLVALLDGTRDRAALTAELRTHLLEQGRRSPTISLRASTAACRASRASRSWRPSNACGPAGAGPHGAQGGVRALLDEEHLRVLRQRPQVVGHDALQAVGDVARSPIAVTTVSRMYLASSRPSSAGCSTLAFSRARILS